MRLLLMIGAVAALLVAGSIFFFTRPVTPAAETDQSASPTSSSTDTTQPVTTTTSPSQASSTTTPPAAGTYTMAQVAAANSASRCWTVVSGTVYDVTSFITQHPGGSARILGVCGVDATASFTRQHGSSARAQETLASFKIGVLR